MSRPRRCECFWEKCGEAIAQTALFENALGQPGRLGLCRHHMRRFADPAFRVLLLRNAERSWQAVGGKLTPNELAAHPAQHALLAHQETCADCAAVRDWIVREQQAGRVTTPADGVRIGAYVIENCCREGIELNYRAGRSFAGLE